MRFPACRLPFLTTFGLAAFAAAALASGPPETVDPAEIVNYTLISPELAVAGRPSDESLARLKQMGFRTVIDLRTEAEGTAAEKEIVEREGLRYVSVPVTPQSLSLADAEAVSKVLDDPQAGPVLLHCASSNRVGGVWALIQVQKGKPVEEALEAGRAAGLKSPVMVEAVTRVLEEAKTPR